MDWVDRLPGPAWAFYLLLGIGVGVAGIAIQWVEAASPVGSFDPRHIWFFGNFCYQLAMVHYIDRSAASGLASFRPLLHSEQGGPAGSAHGAPSFASLSYQLTNLPPRGTLIATLAAAAVAIAASFSQPAADTLRTYFPAIAAAPTATVFVKASFILQLALLGPLTVHTLHQLALISRIYTQYARINIYQLQPLYALSLPGAFTAIGSIGYIYIWLAIRASASQSAGPIEIGLSVVFAAIAGATFALPLLGAHRRLVAEKNRRLAEASSRFEALAEELLRAIDSRRLDKMDPLNKALANLEIVQGGLRRIPTWPWQAGAVRGLLAALLLPVVVWLIQLLLGRLFGA